MGKAVKAGGKKLDKNAWMWLFIHLYTSAFDPNGFFLKASKQNYMLDMQIAPLVNIFDYFYTQKVKCQGSTLRLVRLSETSGFPVGQVE